MNRFQRQFKALGSEVFITVVTAGEQSYAEDLIDKTIDTTNRFEEQFSRFIPNSELTKFNNSSGTKLAVTKSIRDLLALSKEYIDKTDGIFNPFILPVLQKSGYMGSWTKDVSKAQAGMDYSNRSQAGFDDIEIGDSWAKIPKDSAIDFGGIGKGYLLDQLQLQLERQDLTGYWVSLGGDILCSGYDIDNLDWSINIQSALDQTKQVGEISNIKGSVLGIATSGITKRKGVHNGKAWHHIIDPRINRPAETDILTATVTAKSATAADVYAKCILIEGSSNAQKYLDNQLVDSICLQLVDSSIIKLN
jgi:thiamine biosynthesis lipoprotein